MVPQRQEEGLILILRGKGNSRLPSRPLSEAICLTTLRMTRRWGFEFIFPPLGNVGGHRSLGEIWDPQVSPTKFKGSGVTAMFLRIPDASALLLAMSCNFKV
jgi:hypothetical protein